MAATRALSPTLSHRPGLGPGIHVFGPVQDVDGRNKCGHDVVKERQCSYFVLDNSPNLSYIVSLDLPLLRGALARRRSVVAGTVSWHGLARCADGRPRLWAGGRNRFKAPVEQTDNAWNGHRAGLACSPKQAVREEASWLFLITTHHRAGLPVAPPSIASKARSRKR